MKRTLLLTLACLLMLALLPGGLAEEVFQFDPEQQTITGYTGTGPVVEVPSTIGGVPVLAIGRAVFQLHNEIEEVILPEGLTHILENAFYFCENLQHIQLPSTLQAIDSYAFFSCGKLAQLNFPAGFVFLGNEAFSLCGSLSEVRFAGAVPFVASTAFKDGPEDRQVIVPVQELAAYEAMLGIPCQPGGDVVLAPADSQVNVDAATGLVTGYPGKGADLLVPDSVAGIAVTGIAERAFFSNPWIRRVVLPAGVERIGKRAFLGTRLGIIGLPEGLVAIEEEAFAAANLMALALPDSLTTMGRRAFASNKLQAVAIPESLTALPEQAFERCDRLEEVTFSPNLKEIGSAAFEDCSSLDYLIFEGDAPPVIAPDAFLDTALSDIDISWQATRDQAAKFKEAFAAAGVPLDQISVWRADPPDQPPYPASAAMSFDEENQLIIKCEGEFEALTMYWDFWKQDGSGTLMIKGLGPGIFEGSSLKTFYVPHSNAFEIIGERAFAGSQITTLYLFDSVKVIGREAFRDCQNLTELILPDSLERIEEGAFQGCSNLRRLVFEGPAVQLAANAFAGCESLLEVVLPPDTRMTGNPDAPAEAYRISQAANKQQRLALQAALDLPWYMDLPLQGEGIAFVSMPEDLAANPEDEFEFDPATGLIKKYVGHAPRVVVPGEIGGVKVTGIDFLAFSNLSLYTVATGQEDNAGLVEVVLPESLREIGDSAFLNCTGLTRVVCYGPLDRIGIRAFEGCTSLTEIICHNGVRDLGGHCFYLCESLKTAALGDKLMELPDSVFEGCGFEGLLTLDIPKIGKLAFKDNKKVTAIHITDRVTDLGEGVFVGMDGLLTVCFQQTDPGLLRAGFQFDDEAVNLQVHVLTATTDEELAAFKKALNLNLLPGDTMVSRKDCTLDSPVAPEEQPQVAPEEEPEKEQPAQPEATPANGPLMNHRYRCVAATTGGIAVDLAVIGEYALLFSPEGSCVFTISGTDLPPMGYTVQEGTITLDYVAGPLVLNPVEGGYEMDFMGAMVLTFKPE